MTGGGVPAGPADQRRREGVGRRRRARAVHHARVPRHAVRDGRRAARAPTAVRTCPPSAAPTARRRRSCSGSSDCSCSAASPRSTASRLGGIWAAAPLFAWSGLFLALGWNFLDYGLFNPPGDETVIWGWLICGVIFVAMGLAPLLGGLAMFGAAPLRGSEPAADPAGPAVPAVAGRRWSSSPRPTPIPRRSRRSTGRSRRPASPAWTSRRRPPSAATTARSTELQAIAERHGRRDHRGGRGHAGRSAGPGRRRHERRRDATPRRRPGSPRAPRRCSTGSSGSPTCATAGCSARRSTRRPRSP